MKKLLAIIVLLGCGLIGAAAEYKLSNIYILDGDTIRADVELGLGVVLVEQSIRLDGIDTPEIHTTNELEKAAGMVAKSRLTARIVAGGIATIRNVDRDKYGRLLAVLAIDGTDICAELIKQGYARPYQGEAKKPWDMATLQKILDSTK